MQLYVQIYTHILHVRITDEALICKFVAMAAPVPDAAPFDDAVVANNVEDPPPAAVIDPSPPPVPADEVAPPPPAPALKKTALVTPRAKKNVQGPYKGPRAPG